MLELARHKTLFLAPLAAAVCLAGGCVTRSQTFEGYSDDQLWTAMVATAKAPQYDDWKLSENEVMIDEEGRRLEIYRIVRRTLVSPHADPWKEEVEWRMQVVLGRDWDGATPTVDFTARQITVPAWVWEEADRYFAQMRTLLGPVKAPAEPAPHSDQIMPAPLPDEPAAAPAHPAEEPAAAPAAEPPPEPLPE
ncbi:MAG: hypothetical protein ACO3QC_05495 [Phycisphaerales bacterium]